MALKRTKSFKNWYAKRIEVPKAECMKRISSKRANIDRWKEKLEEVKKSRAGVIEGYPRLDYISIAERTIRQLTNEEAKEKKALQTLENAIENADGIRAKLLRHPNIADAIITREDRIKVFTKPLKHGRSDIGAFSISWNPEGKTFFILNETYECLSGGYAHWAVSGNRPCLGEWGEGFMAVMKTFDMFILFDLMIRYLTTLEDGHIRHQRTTYLSKADWMANRSPKKKADQDPDEVPLDETVIPASPIASLTPVEQMTRSQRLRLEALAYEMTTASSEESLDESVSALVE